MVLKAVSHRKSDQSAYGSSKEISINNLAAPGHKAR